MKPEESARRAHQIITTMRGHAAHRAIDLLTNEVLRELGHGEMVDLFEARVSHWHAESDRYPYQGPCPDCEMVPL